MEGWFREAGPDLKRVWGRSTEELNAEAGKHLGEHVRRGRELFRRFGRQLKEARGA